MRRLAPLAWLGCVYAQGSEMVTNPTSFTRTGGLQCNKDTLRNALNKANYDFARKYPGSRGQCGYGSSSSPVARRLDSEEDSDGDIVDWNAINADECANDPLPVLCFDSVLMRDDSNLYIIENADAVLCCWQLGMPPEDYYLAPASWYPLGNQDVVPANVNRPRDGDEWNPYTSNGGDARKLATESGLVVKARSSKAEASSRSKAAGTLEAKETLENNRWTLPHWSRSASLTASLRQLRGDTEGNRRLSSESEGDTADGGDTESDDDDPTPSEGPFGRQFNAFLSGPGNDDYDCSNHYQVRSDVLLVLDQSPWFYDSFCYVHSAASLGQDPFLSSSTSTFLNFPRETGPSNTYANPLFSRRRRPYRRLSEPSETGRRLSETFFQGDFQRGPSVPGIADQCRQTPLYPYIGDVDPRTSQIHVGQARYPEFMNLCSAGINLRADRTWTIAMLTMSGPMKCCLDTNMQLASDVGSELD